MLYLLDELVYHDEQLATAFQVGKMSVRNIPGLCKDGVLSL